MSTKEREQERRRGKILREWGTPDQQVPSEVPHEQSHHWLSPLSHYHVGAFSLKGSSLPFLQSPNILLLRLLPSEYRDANNETEMPRDTITSFCYFTS